MVCNSCDMCDKTFGSVKGLTTHNTRVHKPSSSPIPQLDGVAETGYVTYTFNSDYTEEDVKDSLDIVHSKTKVKVEVVSRVRTHELSADHIYTVKFGPDAPDHFSWPVLDTDDAVVFKDLVKFDQ